MDSLTQAVLGGAIGAAIGGKKYGRKSVLMGALIGTFPDTDTLLFVNSDPITSFTYHRGFSHSFLFALFVSPVLAWILSKIKWLGVGFKDKALHWIVFLGLITHMILDALTIYGTQLFWPLATPPVGIGSVFIIDPLYTLPLLFALGWFLFNKSTRTVKGALVISTAYLIWGMAAQAHITKIAKSQHPEYSKILVQTTPFNTFLWRVLEMQETNYKVGYISVFDKDKEISFKSYPEEYSTENKRLSLLEPIKNSFAVKRLDWFTKGFYDVKQVDNKIIMTDLRMGLEPDDYVFGFIVGKKQNNIILEVKNSRYSNPRNMSQLTPLWNRIWDEDVDF